MVMVLLGLQHNMSVSVLKTSCKINSKVSVIPYTNSQIQLRQ